MTMKELMETKGGPSVVFDPNVSYDGTWNIRIENLIKNSLVKDGKNLFQEFYENTFIKPFSQIFHKEGIYDAQVGLESCPNPNHIGRCLRYSKTMFFVKLCELLVENVDLVGTTPEARHEQILGIFDLIYDDYDSFLREYMELLNEKERRILDILKNKEFSPYYNAFLKDFRNRPNILAREYLLLKRSFINDIKRGILNLGDFFERPIDYNELFKCFDPDVFYLLFARTLIDDNREFEAKTGKLTTSFNYLAFYCKACKCTLLSNKKYDPEITFVDTRDKVTKVSRRQVQAEIENMRFRHPNTKTIKLPTTSNGKYKDIDLINKIIEIYSSNTQVNWELLPKGQRVEKADIISTKPKENYETSEKDIETLIQETNERISFLETSGYMMIIKGLHSFTDYYAYVYPTGKVILEAFWKKGDTSKPQTECATYVMDIDNFIEMSKCSKMTLIEYIRLFPEIDIKRIYHTSLEFWKDEVTQAINGDLRLEDTIGFIEGLNSGAVSYE